MSRVDRVLERWDKSTPELQRGIVHGIATDMVEATESNIQLAKRVDRLENALRQLKSELGHVPIRGTIITVAEYIDQAMAMQNIVRKAVPSA